MKPLKGKRMELKVHCWDSGISIYLHALQWSGWTVCVCVVVRTFAFPSSVREQLLKLSDKPRKKAASFRWCYRLCCANLDSTEESGHMLFCVGYSLPSLFWTMMDCMQCTWTEAVCWGEEDTHCVKVISGHMISYDLSRITDQGVYYECQS